MLQNFISKKDIKKNNNIQGLKILIFGDSGSGKSLSALSFPNLAYIDTESKIGVYLDDDKISDNIEYLLPTNNVKTFLLSLAEIIKSKDHNVNTVVIDSETNIVESTNMVYLEVEKKRTEDKLRKENPNITEKELEMALNDVALNVRSYGHIANANKYFKSLKIILSALGINLISIAHNKEVKDKNNITIDVIPNIYKNGDYDYDVIIETKLRKNIQTLQYENIAIIKKDTTRKFKVGDEINYTGDTAKLYEIFKDKLCTKIKSQDQNNYHMLDDMVNEFKAKEEQIDNLNILYEEFKTKYTKSENKDKIKEILKEKGINKITDVQDAELLKEILKKM